QAAGQAREGAGLGAARRRRRRAARRGERGRTARGAAASQRQWPAPRGAACSGWGCCFRQWPAPRGAASGGCCACCGRQRSRLRPDPGQNLHGAFPHGMCRGAGSPWQWPAPRGAFVWSCAVSQRQLPAHRGMLCLTARCSARRSRPPSRSSTACAAGSAAWGSQSRWGPQCPCTGTGSWPQPVIPLWRVQSSFQGRNSSLKAGCCVLMGLPLPPVVCGDLVGTVSVFWPKQSLRVQVVDIVSSDGCQATSKEVKVDEVDDDAEIEAELAALLAPRAVSELGGEDEVVREAFEGSAAGAASTCPSLP
ncbi:unnamed protein product, partial [Prorocentrum cordatum]